MRLSELYRCLRGVEKKLASLPLCFTNLRQIRQLRKEHTALHRQIQILVYQREISKAALQDYFRVIDDIRSV